MESNHVSENFECDICSKILSNSYQLTKHIKIHSEPTHECELCQKTFNLKANLSTHQKIFHGNKDRIYNCDSCNNTFTSLRYLKHHVTQIHNLSPLKCDKCFKVYKRKHSLKIHIETFHLKKFLDTGIQDVSTRIQALSQVL